MAETIHNPINPRQGFDRIDEEHWAKAAREAVREVEASRRRLKELEALGRELEARSLAEKAPPHLREVMLAALLARNPRELHENLMRIEQTTVRQLGARRVLHAVEARRDAAEQKRAELRADVVRLHREGHSQTAIARILTKRTGRQVTRKVVRGILGGEKPAK